MATNGNNTGTLVPANTSGTVFAVCAKTQLPPNASKELTQLIACKDAAECLINTTEYNSKVAEYNKKVNDAFATALEEYEKRERIYKETLDRHSKRIGEFSRFAKYDGKSHDFWSNDHDGTCWAGENWNAAHDWCHEMANRKGYDGENYWAKAWGWCHGRYGNFQCKKDVNIVATQHKAYMDSKPIFTELRPTRELYPLKELLPSDINIQCCSNYINVKGDVTNVSQDCIQKITKEIHNIQGQPDLPITEGQPDTAKEQTVGDSNYYIIAIVVFIILLLFGSTSMLLIVSRN